MTNMAVCIHEQGGPEVLQWEEYPVGDLQEGEVRVRHTAVGLNFIDTYMRSGIYPLPDLPRPIGLEAAGVVEELGPGVTGLSAGDRVAYASPPPGAYSQTRRMPGDRVVRVPDSVTDEQAAAMMLKGMTAEYLLRRTFRVEPGMTVLFHSAAGGVGLIACQWLKALGATVIGTVGTEEKAELARAHGCDYPILFDQVDWVEEVKNITDGEGVPVVYDSIGKTTLAKSIQCLAMHGMVVLFGQSSGPTDPINLAVLAAGSNFITRPTLMTYTKKREDLEASAAALFDVVGNGQVRIEINQRYALAEAQQAHRDLEGRKTTGSTLLIP
ncbi:MAG: quinone oxidoreductase [Rhodospirillales bacterium]|nr:quinone oxidoreductase [Rhodospirillales bacterium]MXX21582.1 quinone oxidoreductase [Rhodospirillales bacterium]MYE19731.1 quinone oxidoreductase [Rhodospirillales bacterium]